MANLGDIDGDGIDDIAIGATGDGDVLKYFRTDDGGTIVKAEYLARNQGALHILLMNDDGTIKSSTKFDHTTRYMPSLATDFLPFDAEFASAVVSLGDLYNDGTTVIAVGTPTYATVRESEGAVFIMHIGDNGTTLLDVFVIQLKSYGINLVDVLDVMINAPVIDEKEIRAVVKVLESGIPTSAARLGGPCRLRSRKRRTWFCGIKICNSGQFWYCRTAVCSLRIWKWT